MYSGDDSENLNDPRRKTAEKRAVPYEIKSNHSVFSSVANAQAGHGDECRKERFILRKKKKEKRKKERSKKQPDT